MVPVTPILWEKVNIHINVGPIIIETMNLKMANNEECLYGKKYIIVVVVVAVVVVVVPSIILRTFLSYHPTLALKYSLLTLLI